MSIARNFYLTIAVVVTFFIFTPETFASQNRSVGDNIDLWTRAPGLHSEGRDPGRLKVMNFDLKKHAMKTVTLSDFQYGGRFQFKAVKLLDVIESYPLQPNLDRVLLHFKNGMIVPLPLQKNFFAIKKINSWIAVSWRPEKKTGSKEEPWVNGFDDIGRVDERFRDPAPVTFGYNKLVMKDGWHPDVDDTVFTPFRHADTLVGIEFVEGVAYDHQFVAENDTVGKSGWQVYFNRCQYCHAVKKIGATHGWDFLDPVPIYELKTADNLYYRVKYTFHNAMMMGMQMPSQKSVEPKELTDFRNWLKGLAKKKVQAYQPSNR